MSPEFAMPYIATAKKVLNILRSFWIVTVKEGLTYFS